MNNNDLNNNKSFVDRRRNTRIANGRKAQKNGRKTDQEGKKGSNSPDSGRKTVENGRKNGRISGIDSTEKQPKLTQTEKEFLDILIKGITAPKRIAVVHKCGIKDVYKYLGRLRKKGLINRLNKTVEKNISTWLPSTQNPDNPMQSHAEGGAVKKIRLHAQEFHVNILYKDERYREHVGKVINIDGNTVRCYRETLEVYSGMSFYADDVQRATAESFQYWNRFFTLLENDLKILIVKTRAQNIKMVNQHYAEVDNELATDCEMSGDKIRIYATEDNKVWFTIDNSLNLREAETQHPRSANEDMAEVVRPFFNDLRDRKPGTLSEILSVVSELAYQNKETACGLQSVVKFLETQLPHEPKHEVQEQRKGHDPMYG